MMGKLEKNQHLLDPPFWSHPCALLYSLVFSEIYPSSLLIMSKARTKYSNKRKFHVNQHLNKKNVHISEDDGFPSTADINTSNSASSRKIPLPKHSKSPDCGIPSTDPSITGFRFVGMEKLDSVFRLLPCKECYKCSLILQEQMLKRKGCASHLRLFCISCGLAKDFFTSLKIPNQRCFEVNRRLVYAVGSQQQNDFVG